MSDILFPLPLGEDQGEGLQRAKSLTPLSPLPAGEGIWSAPASTALYISSAERTLESSPRFRAGIDIQYLFERATSMVARKKCASKRDHSRPPSRVRYAASAQK